MFGYGSYAQYTYAGFTPFTNNVYPQNVNEQFGLTDTGAVTSVIWVGANVETLTLTEALFGVWTTSAAQTEAFTLSEVWAGFRAQFADYGEALTLAESEDVIANFNPTNAETLSLVDNPVGIATMYGLISEAESLTESYVGANITSASLSDAITSVDAFDVRFIFNVVNAEITTLTATEIVQVNFNPATNETMIILDDQVGRGWFRIVDVQDPNWIPINNTQK